MSDATATAADAWVAAFRRGYDNERACAISDAVDNALGLEGATIADGIVSLEMAAAELIAEACPLGERPAAVIAFALLMLDCARSLDGTADALEDVTHLGAFLQ